MNFQHTIALEKSSRGIYLVANQKSQWMCENLIKSIRSSGCELPIRLIHFGGKPINSSYISDEVEIITYDDFPESAKEFINDLHSTLTCPLGFLYRFSGWFMDWDEFIYSDNDIVAFCDWTLLFKYLDGNHLVHADEEYITEGRYNYDKPEEIKRTFGEAALTSAMTAGHMVVRKTPEMIADFNSAVDWFKANPDIPKKHDQALLHVASLIGGWKTVNLCRPPHNWLSTWAGDYKNSLEVVQKLQTSGTHMSHIHYSGGTPSGDSPIEDFLFANYDKMTRLKKYSSTYIKIASGHKLATKIYTKGKSKIKG